MKKGYLLVSLLMLLTFSQGFSQGFQLGAKFGTDIQKIAGADFSDKFAFGYHLGIFTQISINKTWGIHPELYYSAVNMDTAANFSTVYNSIGLSKLKFGYLNIPVLLNYKVNNNISFQAGPQFSIVTDKNLSLSSNLKSAFKSGDLALVSGLQLYFSRIRVYGRYQIGLSYLNDAGSSDKWKSQTIHLGLGLRIL